MSESTWTRRRADKRERLSAVAGYVDGKLIEQGRLRDTLEGLLRPGDRVALEGDNQKQADFLSRTLAQCDPGKAPRPAHADLVGVAARASRPVRDEASPPSSTSPTPDPQSVRIAQMVEDGPVAHRRHPHLRRAVRADVHRPEPRRRAAVRAKADRDGNLLHRSQHRGHADDRRGRRVSRRRGDRTGRRDRRQRRAAASRHPRRLGRLSWSRPTGRSRSSRCSPATRG